MVKAVASIATASIAIFSAVVLTALLKKRKSNPKPIVSKNTDPPCSESTSDQSHPPGYEYEVFLSFRGPDTRKGFTDFLYTSLKDAGIRTFRDDEELRTGEEIGANLVKAIKESKISIPVFSESYAASKWCLKELTLMLECKKEQNRMILPVFYDVTPNEVRHQTGCYASAFKQHEKKYDSKTVQLWREALAEVGGFKGWESENVADGYEGKLVKLIVLKVLNELKKAQLPVTDALVGIEDRVEAVKRLLDLGTNDVRIVGIWGMGGIGKTTLAKVIYNQILNGFECCSFVKDIRETAHHHGLAYVQSSLVTDLSRRECKPFKNVEEGINEIKMRYRDKKVLILLDDIDHTNQLDALVIRPDSFGQGSRIIITTRKKDVLHENVVGDIYEAEQMNDDNALKLFCKHAFRKDTPMKEFIPLSGEIVKTTGGLPLALEVIGSYLSGKKKALWDATLEKLRIVPHVEVQPSSLLHSLCHLGAQ